MPLVTEGFHHWSCAEGAPTSILLVASKATQVSPSCSSAAGFPSADDGPPAAEAHGLTYAKGDSDDGLK